MFQKLLRYAFVLLLSFSGKASHVVGGDITWTCQGGNYVFQLVFYRDCNGTDVNPVSENLRVWNHPSITTITLPFVSRVDISPLCTEVAGGPNALTCGIGVGGGNGLGAIEKVTYKSNPIAIPGTPPANGWIFTYENFSRNPTITNLQNPNTYGITITAKIFNHPGYSGSCVDNSPVFLQDPYFVSCAGEPFEYNMNAVDPDLDSLALFFGQPLDHYSVNGAYNPPINPAPIPYEPGFSYTSPTPGISLNPGNIPAQVHPSSGNLTFLSMNTGSFAVKVVAQSYRQGVLIAEIEREMQLILVSCSGTNTKPQITGPFAGLFETTVVAGTTVNFNLNATDVELLQNGAPQSNILTATGLMFGSPQTSNSGCLISPCATLNALSPIVMTQGVNTTFNWETSCDHLVNPFGYSAEAVPYHFVFKVQDDYCPVPKVSYVTITINVVNPGIIQAPQIDCMQSDASGNLTVQWTPVSDPQGTFEAYGLYSVSTGLIATINTIGTSSYVLPGAGTTLDAYYLAVISGCNGNTTRFGDTLTNIVLDLNNPSNGTAILSWNDPVNPPRSGMNGYYYIYQEYPAGTWSLIDSVPYGTTNFIDTIAICESFLSYQIGLSDATCEHLSNSEGDDFEDMMTPDVPVISSVSIDTLTGSVVISWDVNGQEDTYGYVIYMLDQNGIPVEIDTVWGINNTSYIHSVNTDNGPLSYTVAAFDSCWTDIIPATYQTSAKAPVHTSVFLESSIDICANLVHLDWSDYIGWANVDTYRIYAHKPGEPWALIGTSSSSEFAADVEQANTYCFVVEGVDSNGNTAFSNVLCIYIPIPAMPTFNYLRVASVLDDNIEVKYTVDTGVDISEVILQRTTNAGNFETIATLSLTLGEFYYVDSNVNVNEESYTYRVQYIDSCGKPGAFSNEAQTILLRVQNDEVTKINYLTWNPYREFDGSILAYHIYRGNNGIFTPVPMAILDNGIYYFEDDVNSLLSEGKICYKVEAVESSNSYGISERSMSNVACAILEPIVYIPNAFMPDGINKIFIPVVSDFQTNSYSFTVYSRLGQTIFRTNDPSEGWDGIIMGTGKMAPPDTYVYMLELRDGNGVELIRRGHVTLIK